ncbi:hypothetical protein PENSUB_4183 [Penicillium subrubescens]|uniref:Uncharacterized protein n=1 Tax=Penicillium subrubescens TaxID=1316194 RepID=A0A1Q5UD53_9EURO|nr:hypothetical protein PENSUB_4183 [Penicillium subrubescens]
MEKLARRCPAGYQLLALQNEAWSNNRPIKSSHVATRQAITRPSALVDRAIVQGSQVRGTDRGTGHGIPIAIQRLTLTSTFGFVAQWLGIGGIPFDFTSAYKARPAGSEPRKRKKQQKPKALENVVRGLPPTTPLMQLPPTTRPEGEYAKEVNALSTRRSTPTGQHGMPIERSLNA